MRYSEYERSLMSCSEGHLAFAPQGRDQCSPTFSPLGQSVLYYSKCLLFQCNPLGNEGFRSIPAQSFTVALSLCRVQRKGYSAAVMPEIPKPSQPGDYSKQCLRSRSVFRSCSVPVVRCLPCAQRVSPYIDRVVPTSCFDPVEDMKGIIGHPPL